MFLLRKRSTCRKKVQFSKLLPVSPEMRCKLNVFNYENGQLAEKKCSFQNCFRFHPKCVVNEIFINQKRSTCAVFISEIKKKTANFPKKCAVFKTASGFTRRNYLQRFLLISPNYLFLGLIYMQNVVITLLDCAPFFGQNLEDHNKFCRTKCKPFRNKE